MTDNLAEVRSQRGPGVRGRRHLPARRRTAFTLLELLLVLGIIVLMAGLSWPAMRSSMAKSRLRDSAQQLRVELARARLQAMENGVPLEFRYRAGEGRFRIATRSVSTDPVSSPQSSPRSPGSGAFRGRGTSGALDQSAAGDSEFTELQLPAGVTFAEPQISWLDKGPAADDGLEVDAEDQSLRSAGWSSAIVFLPDGTTSDATLALRNGQGAQVVVQLRGMTGLAKPGEVEACDDLETPTETPTTPPLETARAAGGSTMR